MWDGWNRNTTYTEFQNSNLLNLIMLSFIMFYVWLLFLQQRKALWIKSRFSPWLDGRGTCWCLSNSINHLRSLASECSDWNRSLSAIFFSIPGFVLTVISSCYLIYFNHTRSSHQNTSVHAFDRPEHIYYVGVVAFIIDITVIQYGMMWDISPSYFLEK